MPRHYRLVDDEQSEAVREFLQTRCVRGEGGQRLQEVREAYALWAELRDKPQVTPRKFGLVLKAELLVTKSRFDRRKYLAGQVGCSTTWVVDLRVRADYGRDEVARALHALKRAASAPLPAPEPVRVRKDRNNGWWRPAPTGGVVSDPVPEVTWTEPEPAGSVRTRKRRVTSPRPGAELDKDMRDVVGRLLEQGWTYQPGGAATGSRASCHVLTPDGERLRVPTSSQRYVKKAIISKYVRAGAKL